ncbi:hypothetical protein [Pedobacter sp. MC2016-24]|uniref:hypothetical protein n=1 Tax=Pedobacter sp. MC2016-24 TaxID=2780090 RepID=UPI00188297B0|nr:hypothetical protein [Pedobacter sp. MC2016-24]MBE9598016.1 hypothetical protein [Pedobacter sp. MC2016-24]
MLKYDPSETKQEIQRRIVQVIIMPFIQAVTKTNPEGLSDAVIHYSQVVHGLKDQFMEEEGAAEEGHLLMLCSGFALNFYYDIRLNKSVVTHIFKKYEVMIDINSFLNKSDRKGNLQMLTDGLIFKMSYHALRSLLVDYPILNVALWQFQAEREKQYLYYQHLLKLALDERVKVYLEDNPGIATQINNDCIANYLGTCRSRFSTAYAKYRAATLKKLSSNK